MTMSQNDTGRALEYGLALEFSTYLPAKIQDNNPFYKAKKCFEICSDIEQKKIRSASHEIVGFLTANDNRLIENQCIISIQSDKQGQLGDVRDILINNAVLNEYIGISAKNRHFAVKHSRLSEFIDFGKDWMDVPCSKTYFQAIDPIFKELRNRQTFKETWREVENKKNLYYLPILNAFKNEMEIIFNKDPLLAAKKLIQYLLGRFDYYKIIKENGHISVMSFNTYGTLKWGSKLPMPTRIIEISFKPNSETTIIMTFDKGWQLSFRIHSARSLVEPSLKFDINLVGLPLSTSRHVTPYHY